MSFDHALLVSRAMVVDALPIRLFRSLSRLRESAQGHKFMHHPKFVFGELDVWWSWYGLTHDVSRLLADSKTKTKIFDMICWNGPSMSGDLRQNERHQRRGSLAGTLSEPSSLLIVWLDWRVYHQTLFTSRSLLWMSQMPDGRAWRWRCQRRWVWGHNLASLRFWCQTMLISRRQVSRLVSQIV
jgi:hypothetical protein